MLTDLSHSNRFESRRKSNQSPWGRKTPFLSLQRKRSFSSTGATRSHCLSISGWCDVRTGDGSLWQQWGERLSAMESEDAADNARAKS